jgi:predicted RNA-binding Zn ribbon-like protein
VGEHLVEPVELGFLVAFVNDYAAEPRLVGGVADDPYRDLAQLAAGEPVALGLVTGVATTNELKLLTALADRLYEVFAKAQAEPASAIEAVNTLLRQSGAAPHLSWGEDASVADWRLPLGPARDAQLIRTLQAGCALALYQWLIGRGSLDRLGVCNAHRCADVYIDVTQASSRRYCSPSCGNRAKVAAHRARARAGPGAGAR